MVAGTFNFPRGFSYAYHHAPETASHTQPHRSIMITQDDILFEVETPLGFKVRVTKEYWRTITTQKHP
jgi:hypothetical protein